MRIDFHHGFAAGAIFEKAYEIVSPLGSGTFGSVYRARQRSTGQDVAIKVLRVHPAEANGDAERMAERFRREMRLCADLYHPNIVRLIDSGTSEAGFLYSVFEYVPGVTLRDLLEAEHTLCLREAVHLMAQVLDALSCAHGRGIVHRDLKPENIMIANTGARRNALVLDFGLGAFTEGRDRTRITATCEMLGTPSYAAPEQLRGEAPAPASDLYSWALVFLESVTGEPAVRGASVHEVILHQLGPEPVVIPSWLRRHRLGRPLEIATRKTVEQREVTAKSLLHALATLEAPELHDVEPTRPLQAPGRERRQLTFVAGRLTLVPLDGRVPDLEAVDELLHAGHTLCAEIAAGAGGQVASLLADRVLLVFGHPRAREDDTKRATRAALRIAAEVERQNVRLAGERQLRIEARFAVHTGLVIVPESSNGTPGDVVGLTPEIAGRLVERAAPGEVLASGEVQRMLGADEARALRPPATSPPVGAARQPARRLRPLRHPRPAHGRDDRRRPRMRRAAHRARRRARSPLGASQAKSRAASCSSPGEPGMGLDLCAAPGGKTTHLAALMGDRGEVVAVERNRQRARALRATAERMRTSSVRVVEADAGAVHDPAGFDRVLLDPPCSGLGTLQSHPDLRWRMTPEAIGELADGQDRLLAAARRALAGRRPRLRRLHHLAAGGAARLPAAPPQRGTRSPAIAGRPSLRTPAGVSEPQPGDIVACPTRPRGSHLLQRTARRGRCACW